MGVCWSDTKEISPIPTEPSQYAPVERKSVAEDLLSELHAARDLAGARKYERTAALSVALAALALSTNTDRDLVAAREIEYANALRHHGRARELLEGYGHLTDTVKVSEPVARYLTAK